jgi:hypothetical protein
MRSQKFESAYKIMLSDFKWIRNLGGYQHVGDYRDIVHDAYVNLSKKYTFNDDEWELKQILSLFRMATHWARYHKMKTLSDQANMYKKTHFSQIEKGYDGEPKSIDSLPNLGVYDNYDELGVNNFKTVKLSEQGYTRQDMINDGLFKNMRVAQYACEREREKFKKLILSENKRLEVTYE